MKIGKVQDRILSKLWVPLGQKLRDKFRYRLFDKIGYKRWVDLWRGTGEKLWVKLCGKFWGL
jgi:hypothetical protein